MENLGNHYIDTKCKPQKSMGTAWICNRDISLNCPYVLKFGHVFLCKNRTLHRIE
jgi:hypothetical protein